MNKKRGVALFLTLILFATLVTAALSQDDRAKISECRNDCRVDQREERTLCKETYYECKDSCKEEYSQCLDDQKEILDTCTEICEISLNDSREQRSCIYECNKEYRTNKRSECSHNDCRKECSSEYKDCRNEVKDEYRDCPRNCQYTALNNNITCEDGKYQGGQKFLEGCEICTCNYNSEITCEKTDYCNFESVEVTEETCVESGGLFQGLCRGPYFGIGCTQDKFCLCEGINEYSCPADHTCVKDFKEPRIKRSSISGWKTLLGEDLGDIGVCAQNPILETCGNGICDNILQDSETAETEFNCPIDCAK